MRKFVVASLVLVLSVAVAAADEFVGFIIKYEDGKITVKKSRDIEAPEEVTLKVDDNVKIFKSKFNKDTQKLEAGEAFEGGKDALAELVQETAENVKKWTEEGKKGFGPGVFVSIVTDGDTVTEIRVTGGGKKKKAPPADAIDEELPHTEQVLKKYVEAMGGEMAILAIEPLTIAGRFVTPQASESRTFVARYHGDNYSYRLTTRRPQHRTENIRAGHIGDKDWWFNEGTEEFKQAILKAKEYEDRLQFFGHPRFAIYLANYPGTVSVAGRRKANGDDCFELLFVDRDGNRRSRCFNAKTGLQTHCTEQMGTRATQTLRFEYQPIDGIQFLKKMDVLQNDDLDISVLIESVTMYDDIDPAEFALPDISKRGGELPLR